MPKEVELSPQEQGFSDATAGRPRYCHLHWSSSQREEYGEGYRDGENKLLAVTKIPPPPPIPSPKYIQDQIKHGINRCYAGGRSVGLEPWAGFGFGLASQLRGHPDTESPPPKTAEEFLRHSRCTMRERGKTYDTGGGERSMGKTVAAFNLITGLRLTEAEGWLLLQTLKDVRQWASPGYHADSAIDGVAYSALKSEALAK